MYRIIKAGNKHIVQKKRFILSGWETLGYYYDIDDAISFLAISNPNYIPKIEDILIEQD